MGENMEKRGGERTREIKSNFSVTCSLLSQYLKEKGSFRDLSLEMAAPGPLVKHDQQKEARGKFRVPTTMNLLPGVDIPDEGHPEDDTEQNAPTKSMDLFPQHAGFDSPVSTPAKDQESVKASNIKELQKAQLTIFYGGKVLVFDKFPADKAKDLMQMASKESTTAAQNFGFKAPSAPIAECSTKPNSILATTSGGQLATVAPEKNLPKPANASDMPIARRNSLHRFLEKRKDRIVAKAPYQVHGGSPAPDEVVKPEDSQPWLGLGPKVAKPENSAGKPENSSGNSR